MPITESGNKKSGRAGGLLGLIFLFAVFAAGSCVAVAQAGLPQATAPARYLGSQACAKCHQPQFSAWRNSHHAKAMLPATANSVLGDFDNARVSHGKVSAHFQRQGQSFYVSTQGVGGQLSRFEVRYTFGFSPLQQYLIAFPGGRLQTLPWAWDTEKNRWFYVPEEIPAPDDWLYWTNGAMNWNSMCADCHSTNLKKNYHAESDSYATTWSEINVGCEACHGPGAEHVRLAETGAHASGAAVLSENQATTAVAQVEQCARCHSRRSQLTGGHRHGDALLDHYLPEVLRPGLYHSDGQIQDEVFVYGSFVQSKMYRAGVSCSSCHDVHSGKLRAQGNQVCSNCHDAARYDTPEHHHHAEDPAAAKCMSCHMPGKFYMGVDFRHDHSMRAPRPDLSATYGTPNACNSCHKEQPPEWAAAHVVDWYGQSPGAHFSATLAAAAEDLGSALGGLTVLAKNTQQAAIARATAVFWLANAVAQRHVQDTLIALLSDEKALVRFHAATALEALPAAHRLLHLPPLLEDPVRAVRIAAAATLADVETTDIPSEWRQARQQAAQEQQQYMAENADLPGGQGYIALQYERQGEWQAAKDAYQRALALDQRNTALRLNLAHLLYRLKEYQAAELKRYHEAEEYLSLAHEHMPDDPRVKRNLRALRAFLER